MATEVCKGAGARQHLALARQQFAALAALGLPSFNRKFEVGDATISLARSPSLGDKITIKAGAPDLMYRARTGASGYESKIAGGRGIPTRLDVSTGLSPYGTVSAATGMQWTSGRYVINLQYLPDEGLLLGLFAAYSVRISDPITNSFRDVTAFWAQVNVGGVPYISITPLGTDPINGGEWIAINSLGPHPTSDGNITMFVTKVKLSTTESVADAVWPTVAFQDFHGGDNISVVDTGTVMFLTQHTGMYLVKLDAFNGTSASVNLTSGFSGLLVGGEVFLARYSGVVCPKKGTIVLALMRYLAGNPDPTRNRPLFFRSTDTGASWSLVSPDPYFEDFVYGSFQSIPMLCSYYEDHVAYATGGDHLVWSVDGGITWTSEVMGSLRIPGHVAPYLPGFFSYIEMPAGLLAGTQPNAMGDVTPMLVIYKDHRLSAEAWRMPLAKANYDQVSGPGMEYLKFPVGGHFGVDKPLRPGHRGFLE